MARIICGGLIGLALLSCSPAFAQPPEWSRGLRELSVSKDECLRRAAAAFRREGLQIDVQDQTFVIGTTKYSHTAAVGCFPMGESRTWVTILVASNGGWGHQVKDGLMREITMPGEPPSVGGTLFDDPEPPPPNPDIPPACRGTPWDYSPAGEHRGKTRQRFQHTCPANGCNNGRLTGTDRYADSSSVCLAAVHAGLITFRNGGAVTYEMIPDAGEYLPSVRHGLLSERGYGYNGAFQFVR